jgi:MoaA/NifB/PqqE/SkfB family radical SAM enzyme
VHRPDRSNDEVLRVRSFENVLANMAICADRRVRFSINSVITSESIHLMSAMVDFALTCGARKISFIPVIPRGRASGTEGLLYSTELQCIRERTAELALQHHDNIIVRCIDIRQRDYWVIENDGTIWIEREAEQLDRRIGDLADLLGTDCKP